MRVWQIWLKQMKPIGDMKTIIFMLALSLEKKTIGHFFEKLKFPVSKYKYLMLSIRNPFRYCLVKILFRSFVYYKKKEDSLYFGQFLKAVYSSIDIIGVPWIKLRKLKNDY